MPGFNYHFSRFGIPESIQMLRLFRPSGISADLPGETGQTEIHEKLLDGKDTNRESQYRRFPEKQRPISVRHDCGKQKTESQSENFVRRAPVVHEGHFIRKLFCWRCPRKIK